MVAETFKPASWPTEVAHEWCPPGHGDLYPAMLGSGTLDRLLAKAKPKDFKGIIGNSRGF